MSAPSNLTRKEKREYQRAQQVLSSFITSFFKESIKIYGTKLSTEDKKEIAQTGESKSVMIVRKYNKYNTMWRRFVGQYNSSTTIRKEAFLMIDSFENAIRYKGHITIKASNENYKTKYQMLKCIYPVQMKMWTTYFFRDFRVLATFFFIEYFAWLKRVRTEKPPVEGESFPEQMNRVHGTPLMDNPPAPPAVKLTATVTE